MRKYILIIFAILISVSLLPGCSRDAKEVSLTETEREPVAAPPKETLKIAVSAIISPKKTFIYYREILDYISGKMAMPIELVQRDTYAEVNNLVKNKEISAAFVCSGAYIDGHKEFGMELLAAPVAYGEPYYYSYIIVPEESSIENFNDLRGRKFAFTDPMSNSGKLSPTYMLSKMGETPVSFFSGTIFTYSHDKSIEAVAKKMVDGAAVDSLIWDYANATDSEFTSRTRIISKSPPYGIPPVVVPKGLSPVIRDKLKEIFLNMHLDPEGRKILEKVKINRFIIIDDSAYDSIREMKAFVEK